MKNELYCRNLSGIRMPMLGLGCMRLPKIDPKKDEIDYDMANAIVDRAYELGIRYFDTAYIYHGGDSEIFIGKALAKYPRESFYLADKMPIWSCKNIEDVKRIFFEQLKKCQVEYFDFYLCHAMSKDRHQVYIKMGVYDFLIDMKEQGYIRKLGFSYHDIPQNVGELLDYYDWDFVQIQFNYIDDIWQNAAKLYDEVARREIDIIVMEPVRGGFLANLPKKYAEPLQIRPWTNASWALRWVIQYPRVKMVLSGMSALNQLEDNVETFIDYTQMTLEECQAIDNTRELIKGTKYVPCTGCRYCLPCPMNVSIPQIFEVYNESLLYGSLKRSYNKIKPENNISQCVSCKQCENKCPQQIKIASRLEEMQKEIENVKPQTN